ncbi:MAG: Ig-like domain-containing protein [Bacteroidetes bacterium]|nr:Ig-like domain-containing protein [Bacteroidota bacterium]
MAFKHYLIGFSFLLLSACAQVGTITGGPKDEIAPKVVKASIKDGTTNFEKEFIEFTFDEFVQTNKPLENIIIVPQHTRLESRLIKKTLRIDFSNELQKNTTYTLYLNAAVKDLTEGNDSLMRITFSTGPKLDSLKFVARTIDAFSNQIKSKITIGLFDSLNSDKPIYFGQSNQFGYVNLPSLKQGTYYCKAFDDKNKDLRIQKDEAQDWKFEPIVINTNSSDTLDFKLSIPLQPDRVKNAKLIPPGLIGVHVPNTDELTKISLNGQELKNDRYWRPQEDSLQIAIGESVENEFLLIVNTDTFNLRRLEKNKIVKLTPKNVTKENEISNSSSFEVMDFIESVDTTKIEVLKYPDSSKVNFTIDFEKNRIQLQPSDKQLKKYIVTIKDGAIKGLSDKLNNPAKVEILGKEDRELGTLNVKLSKPLENFVIQLFEKEKLIAEQKIDTNSVEKPIVFSRLNPGEYTFRIIQDVNQNGKWDPISPENQLKAERVLQFSTTTKVRANWEVETILELKDSF